MGRDGVRHAGGGHGFSDLHYFTGLHSLTIHNGMFDDYTFLMVMPYLEKLDLSGSLVSAQTLEYIGTLTDLSDLNLSGCGLSNIVALSGAKAMEHSTCPITASPTSARSPTTAA